MFGEYIVSWICGEIFLQLSHLCSVEEPMVYGQLLIKIQSQKCNHRIFHKHNIIQKQFPIQWLRIDRFSASINDYEA